MKMTMRIPRGWGGGCDPLLKTFTLFLTKIADFRYPIYDLTEIQYSIYHLNLRSIPCFRPG